ncbi:hypothetical protein, partial [Nonomuraea sp. NPDC005501]|uniref:hypothetical protein n=1 Tax=Nonomuraea sp. NPDC005501 TaxID=3156884 RepID=UPI00339F751E
MAPSSAAWVRALWRSWCSVHGPPGQIGGRGLEQLGSPAVGQPGSAGGGVDVGRRQRDAGAPAGEEHRASA